MVSLNAYKRIQRNILPFQYQLVKNLILVKQLRTDYSLLIALDLCRPHYQVLLIIYLKNVIVISAKIVNPNLIVCHLKIIN